MSAVAYTPSSYTLAVATEVVETMAARDVTVEELSDVCGIGPIALGNRLDGRAPWNLDQVYTVAQALQVDVWALLAPDLASASWTPAEYGVRLASLEPPITPEVAEAAARILATVEPHDG